MEQVIGTIIFISALAIILKMIINDMVRLSEMRKRS